MNSFWQAWREASNGVKIAILLALVVVVLACLWLGYNADWALALFE